MLSPTEGQVTHVLLTRAPLYSPTEAGFLVRLACVKHAASVRPEPGSNSPVKLLQGLRIKRLPVFDVVVSDGHIKSICPNYRLPVYVTNAHRVSPHVLLSTIQFSKIQRRPHQAEIPPVGDNF